MNTVCKLLGVIVCMLIFAGCEDDPTYPGSTNTIRYPIEGLMVTLKLPFETEFDVACIKGTYNEIGPLVVNDLWDVIYWYGFEPDQPVYALEAYGDGENEVIGNFNFRMSTIWQANKLAASSAKITAERMGSLNIRIKDDLSDLTPDYPFDLMSYEKDYIFFGGDGKLSGSQGDGLVKFIVSDSTDNLIRLIWNGTLSLVISR